MDAIFHALADPVRRSILERLEQGEARVTDLAAPFPISLNAVSKHIKVLEGAGLVVRRRQGREHRVAVADPEALAQASDWLERRRRFWEGRLDALERALAQAQEEEHE